MVSTLKRYVVRPIAVIVFIAISTACSQTILPSSKMPEYLVMLTGPLPSSFSRCSGVALNEYYILTASHCVKLRRVVTQYNQETIADVVLDLPETDILLLKVRDKLLLKSFAVLGQTDTASPGFIYGICPYYFQHVGRRVDYLSEDNIMAFREKVERHVQKWVTVAKEQTVCGGDSGGIVIQNEKVVGITSAIDPLILYLWPVGRTVYTVPSTEFQDAVDVAIKQSNNTHE